jgi:glycosyltransferase involved in cell wall biosynthesis
MTTPDYSIVIPVHDEADCLPELIHRLRDLLDRLDGPAEVILVDDGSTDRSHELMLQAHTSDPRFHVIQLSRNFGHQAALTAGLDRASGRAVVAMDADLQDPPEVVLEMAARWREGYEVVHAVRRERQGETRIKRSTASWYYRFLGRLSEVEIPADVGDFRLVDRRALEAFKSMREGNRYVRGLFAWIGFRQTDVPYVRGPRHAGRTKYPTTKMMKLAFDGIISLSTAPLRLALRIGFLLSALSILAGITAIVLKLSGALSVPGWASLIVAITFLGGIQLSTLGIMGEYLARIHDEVRGRPLYLVREVDGAAPNASGGVRDARASHDEAPQPDTAILVSPDPHARA